MDKVYNSRDSRLVLLDLFRSLAIILLMIGHIGYFLGSKAGSTFINIGLYQGGVHHIAVTIFLILSGLVLGLKYKTSRSITSHLLKNVG
ncbi:MAG: acyltransferase family protein [Patescibacteria group bacterium]